MATKIASKPLPVDSGARGVRMSIDTPSTDFACGEPAPGRVRDDVRGNFPVARNIDQCGFKIIVGDISERLRAATKLLGDSKVGYGWWCIDSRFLFGTTSASTRLALGTIVLWCLLEKIWQGLHRC